MLKFTNVYSGDDKMASISDVTQTRPVFPPRTVLVAMDGSEESKFAFYWYAKNVYRDCDRVVLVYAVEFQSDLPCKWLYSFTESDEEKVGNYMEDERQRHKGVMKDFSQMLSNSKILGEVNAIHSKSAGEGIIEAAKDIRASFIVTGTRGRTKVKRTFLGSVSDYIIRHAHIPVILCRYSEAKNKVDKNEAVS